MLVLTNWCIYKVSLKSLAIILKTQWELHSCHLGFLSKITWPIWLKLLEACKYPAITHLWYLSLAWLMFWNFPHSWPGDVYTVSDNGCSLQIGWKIALNDCFWISNKNLILLIKYNYDCYFNHNQNIPRKRNQTGHFIGLIPKRRPCNINVVKKSNLRHTFNGTPLIK